MENKEWLKTDKYQYLRKLSEYEYELIEAADNNGEYAMLRPAVINVKGYNEPDEELLNIITMYYDSYHEFQKKYPEPEWQKQHLAEMIYESSAGEYITEAGILTAEQAEEALIYYINNDCLPDFVYAGYDE